MSSQATSKVPVSNDQDNAPSRQEILDLCREWYDKQGKRAFVPGETYIPPSGKVLDSNDLVHLVDSSLDMWLTGGRFSKEFEKKLAARFGLKYACLTVSGSAANLLAFTALTSPKLEEERVNEVRVKPGDEVITVACGFPTTVAPIVQNNCVPVFVDVNLETANANVARIADAITPKTRAIMLAHTLGNPFDLAAISALAEQHNLYLIEDCCDAFGATFKNKEGVEQGVGTFGDIATVSFYPAHHITTGEGGAVMTNGFRMKRIIESFRDWGRDCWCDPGKDNTCGRRFSWELGELPFGYDHKYTYSHIGYNMKVSDMQAAVGYSQIDKVDGFIAKRRENFNGLRQGCIDAGLEEHFVLPEATPGSDPSWFGYLLTIRDGSPLKRRDVVQYLEEHKVGTRLLFAGNLTRQPAFKGVNYRVVGDLNVSDKIMNDSFWIGVWPGIGPAERAYMIETLSKMVKEMVK